MRNVAHQETAEKTGSTVDHTAGKAEGPFITAALTDIVFLSRVYQDMRV
jgi:hypothetical protein